jgi:cobalt-zinc-cadmium efflux system membrane fusion protein
MKISTNKLSMNKAIIILMLLALGLGACKKVQQPQEAGPFVMTDTMRNMCEFASARPEDVKAELKLFGKVVADNSKQAQVFPAVGGVVMKINAELGDAVVQGQVLASVRSSEVAEYKKEYLDAESDVALAEKNLRVAKDLYEGKLNSEKDVISARRELDKANAALVRIQEVYHIYNLGEGSIYNITAPISGFILSKNINQNEQLRSDNAGVLFSIAQIDEVWVLANVNESDISKVHAGVEADVQTVSYPDKIYHGKIDKIFNAIDPQTRAMKVLVKVPNTDLSLKPDMNASVTLRFLDEGKRLIAIPSSSVIFDNSRNYVMVFRDKQHIETRNVEVYRHLGDVTYLKDGLKDGERVISKNGLMIYDALND